MFSVTTPNDDPYCSVISKVFATEFPGQVKTSCSELVDIISAELLGTGQHRYGPIPSPEVQVSIRDVIRNSMKNSEPIPILIPWGCAKFGPWGVDVAEVMGVKQMLCLIKRVRQYYPPGLQMRMRLEDLTVYYLFGEDSGFTEKVEPYAHNLVNLITILQREGGNDDIHVIPESRIMDRDEYMRKAEENAYALLRAMKAAPDARPNILKPIGWTGNLPDDQIDHYLHKYMTLYPGLPFEERRKKVAEYFAASLTRVQMKGVANFDWGEHLTMCFHTYTGSGPQYKRLFYRTMPIKFTKKHIPPWIGKGYIKVNGNVGKPAIAGWSGDGLDYEPLIAEFSDGENVAQVQADYVVVK